MNELPPTTAITTNITLRTDIGPSFATWQSKFTRAASQALGFLYLDIAPAFAGSSDWQIIQRFRSPEALDLWRASSVRRQHCMASNWRYSCCGFDA